MFQLVNPAAELGQTDVSLKKHTSNFSGWLLLAPDIIRTGELMFMMLNMGGFQPETWPGPATRLQD